MYESSPEIDAVAAQAQALPLLEKVKLLELLATQIQQDLTEEQRAPRRSLYGIVQGSTVLAEDIENVRREMWATFPRENLE